MHESTASRQHPKALSLCLDAPPQSTSTQGQARMQRGWWGHISRALSVCNRPWPLARSSQSWELASAPAVARPVAHRLTAEGRRTYGRGLDELTSGQHSGSVPSADVSCALPPSRAVCCRSGAGRSRTSWHCLPPHPSTVCFLSHPTARLAVVVRAAPASARKCSIDCTISLGSALRMHAHKEAALTPAAVLLL